MTEISKAVLITGCSTGIGRATAERLAANGHTVYATARRPESIEDLGAKGCKLLSLDVLDEGSMTAAVRAVEDAEGAVGALVNNAGYSLSGAVETLSLDQVRKQYETNVFGLVRMCQLVLPGMRRQRFGRIVNISSMGGKVVFPGGAFYHGTKFSVEAISDALRFEVAPFGVAVSVVEPGLIKTEFGNAARASLDASGDGDGVYDEFNRSIDTLYEGVYAGPMSKMAAGPDAVAKAIEKAITRRRPRTRYVITAGARFMLGANAIVTDRMWDRLVGAQYPRPKA